MTDLERRLVDLGDHLDVPLAASLPRAVAVRVEGRQPGRARLVGRWRRWVVGVAVVAAGVGVAPAMAGWLGVGGVSVQRSPAPPSTGVALDLGRRVGLAEAARVAGFDPLLPAALGPPSEVRVDDRAAPTVVWLSWDAGPTMTQIETGPMDVPVLQKYAPGVVEEVRVGRWDALWVPEPHEVVLGSDRTAAGVERRAAAPTLLVAIGSVTVRIETDGGLEEALRIARSLPGT